MSLNYLLHEVPKPPKQSRISHLFPSNTRYILPFSKERDLVEVLSFLSKTGDGPDYIPAICVEQDPARKILRVFLAVNKRTWSDGNDILRYLKEELGKVFSVLHNSQYENDSPSKIKKEILDSILEMCSSRILCRLRLISSQRKGKRKGSRPSVKEILQRAIEGMQFINPDKMHSANLMNASSSFTTKSKKVLKLVNNWSNHQVPSRLSDLVEGIVRLNEVQNLSDLLRLIPSGASGVVQDSNFASSLLNIISKVTRYHEAARVLYRIAKKFPLVRNMVPQLATLPPEAYDRLHNPGYSPNFHEIVSRLGKMNGQRYNPSLISRFVRSVKDKDLSEQFSELTKKSLKEAKVHSEIQLLAYCEIQSLKLFPRVVASSKDACFLCNAFIEQHGKMHTSRTHGRLYPGWRLPILLQFKDLEQNFNQMLMNHFRQTIEARVKCRALVHPQPNESSLLPLSVSASTLSTLKRKVKTPVPSTVVSAALPLPRPESMKTEATTATSQELGSPLASTRMLSSDSVVVSHALAPEETFYGCISSKNASPFFIAGPLEVQFDMETGSTSESPTKSLDYRIERIKVDHTKKLRDGSLVVDPLGLEKEILYKLPEDNTFCIAVQDVTLKIICYPETVG